MQAPEILDIATTEEDMPLRKEDKDWIADEIRTAVQEHLNPHGWRKAFKVLREWAPLGGIFAVVATLIAIIVALTIGITSRRESDAKFQGKTEQRLDDIAKFQATTEQSLTDIKVQLLNLRARQSPGPVLQDLSRLDPKTFSKALPVLEVVSKQSPTTVKPSPETVREIANKLRTTDPQSQDYWPAVLQFLSFASAGLSTDVPPRNSPNTILASENEGLSLGVISKKVVVLDGGELVDTRVENSRVIFTEKPVKFRNVVFVNCVFEMPIVDKPNDYLKRASEVLLASELNSASFPSL